jgi:DNA-binding NarL/FixJ family response regulator
MRDAIAIVEAGYRLDLDDDQWLREVLRASLGAMGWDRGVIGFYLDTRETAASVMSPPIALDAHPLITQAATSAVAMMPRGEQARFFLVGPTVSTGSALMKMLRPSNEAVSAEYRAKLGFGDTFSVRIFDASGIGMAIAGLTSSECVVSPPVARMWRCVASHLGAALRLRQTLAREVEAPPAPEAVLDTDGRVHHAEGAARSKAHQSTLREAVLAMVRARGDARDDGEGALELWQALVAGRWSLVDRFESDGRRYVLARRNPPGARDPRGLSPHERAAVHYLALGHSNKEVAYALGLAEGTIAALAARVYRKLGVRSRPELVERIFGPSPAAREVQNAQVKVADEELRVVSWDATTAAGDDSSLTTAELEIARAVARGMSNAEIAAARSTSARTVANQLAAIYRKLKVGSRVELARKLAKPPAKT